MVKTIWFMWKPGEERTYALTVQPSEFWVALQKREGFNLVSFEIELPDLVDAKLGKVFSVE
jgi:hypothetical protein